jgi:hypothetical protein
MSLWDDIKSWLHAPLKEPLDMGNWVLLLILSATVAYGWSRILNHVLEE